MPNCAAAAPLPALVTVVYGAVARWLSREVTLPAGLQNRT